jgi:hypothetical protein
VNKRGWNALRDNWQVTYRDLDYTVLNFLCKKTIAEQDEILVALASLDLRGIHNLSAYLSSMIQKHGNIHQVQGGMNLPLKRNEGKRDQRPQGSPQVYVAQPPVLPPVPATRAPGIIGTLPLPFYPVYVPQQCLPAQFTMPCTVGNFGNMHTNKKF